MSFSLSKLSQLDENAKGSKRKSNFRPGGGARPRPSATPAARPQPQTAPLPSGVPLAQTEAPVPSLAESVATPVRQPDSQTPDTGQQQPSSHAPAAPTAAPIHTLAEPSEPAAAVGISAALGASVLPSATAVLGASDGPRRAAAQGSLALLASVGPEAGAKKRRYAPTAAARPLATQQSSASVPPTQPADGPSSSAAETEAVPPASDKQGIQVLTSPPEQRPAKTVRFASDTSCQHRVDTVADGATSDMPSGLLAGIDTSVSVSASAAAPPAAGRKFAPKTLPRKATETTDRQQSAQPDVSLLPPLADDEDAEADHPATKTKRPRAVAKGKKDTAPAVKKLRAKAAAAEGDKECEGPSGKPKAKRASRKARTAAEGNGEDGGAAGSGPALKKKIVGKRSQKRAQAVEIEEIPLEQRTLRDIIRAGLMADRKMEAQRVQNLSEMEAAINPQPAKPAVRVEKSKQQAADAAPQVQVVDGRIVVNQNTLVVEAQQDTEITNFRRVVEDQPLLNSRSFSNWTKGSRWKKDDTELFYQALGAFGADFSMIARLFPDRNRGQVKRKYLRECKQCPGRMEEVLGSKNRDSSTLKMLIQRLKDAQQQDAAEGEPSSSSHHSAVSNVGPTSAAQGQSQPLSSAQPAGNPQTGAAPKPSQTAEPNGYGDDDAYIY